ncbi:hypothetical protein [uncultured Shewanella sp.]|uniref:hypothetical protein n=1 Tax=uncultured Shewanella sp. TaxID=173975 RepID=UPI0026268026|nr:hypothetical protein [uncultured Shewanella sp.]
MKNCVYLCLTLLILGLSTPIQAKLASNAMATRMNMMDHSHTPIEVPEATPIPALSLSLSKDIMTGYNVHLIIDNFSITPPPVDAKGMDDLAITQVDKKTGILEGHAHLYINGIKTQRLYGQDVHISGNLLKQGINSISVTLNNHRHMYWTVSQQKVVATLYIDTQSPKLIKYQFEGFPVQSTLKQ